MSREAAELARGTTRYRNPTTARAHTLRSGAGALVPRMTAAPCVCVVMMVIPRRGAAGIGPVGWGVNLAADFHDRRWRQQQQQLGTPA